MPNVVNVGTGIGVLKVVGTLGAIQKSIRNVLMLIVLVLIMVIVVILLIMIQAIIILIQILLVLIRFFCVNVMTIVCNFDDFTFFYVFD